MSVGVVGFGVRAKDLVCGVLLGSVSCSLRGFRVAVGGRGVVLIRQAFVHLQLGAGGT